MKPLNVVALLLVAAGAINWGIYGLTNINPIAQYLATRSVEVGGMDFSSTTVLYTLIGLAGLYSLNYIGQVFFERKPHAEKHS